jgi:hypothetical protein
VEVGKVKVLGLKAVVRADLHVAQTKVDEVKAVSAERGESDEVCTSIEDGIRIEQSVLRQRVFCMCICTA